MATAPTKKAPTPAPVKASVVPAKKIATAAAKAVVKKTVSKAPVKAVSKVITAATVASKPAVTAKAINKPATKGNGKAQPTSASPAVAALVKEKAKKAKLVRDSFTMPESEYALLSHAKKICLAAGIEVKKSQLLRIGVLLLSKTDVASLKTLIGNLEPLKAGRPKKDK